MSGADIIIGIGVILLADGLPGDGGGGGANHQRAAAEAPERGEQVPAGVRPSGDHHHGRHLPQHRPQDNPRQVMIGPNIF